MVCPAREAFSQPSPPSSINEALHCVSRSINSTRCRPQAAAACANITEMVDLPTPPFRFDTARNRVIIIPLRQYLARQLSDSWRTRSLARVGKFKVILCFEPEYRLPSGSGIGREHRCKPRGIGDCLVSPTRGVREHSLDPEPAPGARAIA